MSELHEITLEDFDCGLILGFHKVVVAYRYTPSVVDVEQVGDQDIGRVSASTIDIIWANVILNEASKARDGINIAGMIDDEDKFQNMVIDLHEESV
jgi:hypothetical protein